MTKHSKKKIRCIVFLYALIIHIPIFSQDKLPNFYDQVENKKLARQIVEKMSDEELLAQTFMFSWKHQTPGELIIDWVRNTGLGSIKLFGWNTGNSYKLAKAVRQLQKEALKSRFSIPLFVATDQEGGWVRHVKGRTSQTPGNLSIGASGHPIDAYYNGYYISQELRALGINLNFAPTVDILSNLNSKIIGPRVFGDEPKKIGLLGIAFMKGSHDAGVLTTAKHFPGHGDTAIDSHGRIPKINISKKKLEERELVPFKFMIDAKVPFVMCGHLNFPKILPNGEPASFSKYILQDLLRKELGFKGLIVTDDIMMLGAINFAGSLEAAFRKALLAGNNIIESSKTPEKTEDIWLGNLAHLKVDAEFRNCVKDSAYRIILAKLNYFKSKNHVPLFPDAEHIAEALPCKSGKSFFLGLASRSTTIVRNESLPFKAKEEDKVLLAADYDNFFKCGRKRFHNADSIDTDSAIYYARKYDTIIFCLANNYSLANLKELIQKYPEKKYFIISVLSPVFINNVPEVKNVIAVYSTAETSLQAAFAVLCGDFVSNAKMPIKGVK